MRKKIGTILIIVGAVAIIAASALSIYFEWQDRQAGAFSRETLTTLSRAITAGAVPESPQETPDMPEILNGDDAPFEYTQPYLYIDGAYYIGILSIPVLSLELPVNMTFSYAALNNTPCRYTGSIAGNDLVISAHSFSRHFGRLNRLNAGDIIVFTDVLGTEFLFVVAGSETVRPTERSHVVDSEFDLTLFSCTIDGRARVVVRAQRT